MRWRINTEIPREGQRRAITKFAWLPTKVKLDGLRNPDGSMKEYRIWLERYSQVQKYVSTKQKIGSTYGWIDKEKYIYGNTEFIVPNH